MAYDPRDHHPLTWHGAVGGFSAGTDTPRAYLERCLATIAQAEPGILAWVTLNESGARDAADASSARWRAGSPLSPIDGMPLGIKDLLETRDMPTEQGCAAYRGNFPKRDNAAVAATPGGGRCDPGQDSDDGTRRIGAGADEKILSTRRGRPAVPPPVRRRRWPHA